MPDNSKKYAKICLLGSQAAGKTALFNRVLHDDYVDHLETTFGSYHERFELDEFMVTMWDTGGHPRWDRLSTFHMSDSGLIILVVDPLSEDFENDIVRLRNRVDQHRGVNSHSQYLLVAMKNDQVLSAEQVSLAQHNCKAFRDLFSAEIAPQAEVLCLSATDAQMRLVFKAMALSLLRLVPVNTKETPVAKATSEKMDSEIIERLDALKTRIEKRLFKPDATRMQSIERLKTSLNASQTTQDMRKALIEEAVYLRTPDENGKLRYGINLGSTRFKFFVHLRSYEHSSLYQFIKRELDKIDGAVDLAVVSAPRL